MADGSVHFLNENTDTTLFSLMGQMDDAQPASLGN